MKRRALLTGLIAAAGLPGGRWLARGQQPADLAACLAEPGIALYLDLYEGDLVMTQEELLPRADWLLFASPATPVSFYFPPDWTGQVLFATTFTQAGAPQWSPQQTQTSGLVAAQVVSPDGSAGWAFVAGTLLGVMLDSDQAATVAERGVLGDATGGTRFCAYGEPGVLGWSWLTGVEQNGSTLLTNGELFVDGSGFSVLSYYTLYGPQAQFEALMRTVFLPIQWQLLRTGEGLVIPTPTP
jgi:hypothetical protein